MPGKNIFCVCSSFKKSHCCVLCSLDQWCPTSRSDINLRAPKMLKGIKKSKHILLLHTLLFSFLWFFFCNWNKTCLCLNGTFPCFVCALMSQQRDIGARQSPPIWVCSWRGPLFTKSWNATANNILYINANQGIGSLYLGFYYSVLKIHFSLKHHQSHIKIQLSLWAPPCG